MRLSKFKGHLLSWIDKSNSLKESLTIAEMESFKNFVKSLTLEQATELTKGSKTVLVDDEEDLEAGEEEEQEAIAPEVLHVIQKRQQAGLPTMGPKPSSFNWASKAKERAQAARGGGPSWLSKSPWGKSKS